MTSEQKSRRLDVTVVMRGLAPSRNRAARIISDGAVFVNGRSITKPAWPVHNTDTITLKGGLTTYVSRAAMKLARTLDALTGSLDVSGRHALDIGASTGGFTQVLLERGAPTVIALDVGHDQLVPTLREDERVHVMEKVNARTLTANQLPWTPTVIVADVSFISLTKIIPAVARISPPGADLLLMVKPQFEVGRSDVKAGVVTDPHAHQRAIHQVLQEAEQAGLTAKCIIPSALPGPQGNREYFVWFTVDNAEETPTWRTVGVEVNRQAHIAQAVSAAVGFALNLDVQGRSVPQDDGVPATQCYWLTGSDA